MKVAFFNFLPLEYGGGTARFFLDASSGLKKRFKDLDISLVTFNENLAKKITSLYSFYFQRDVKKELLKNNLDLRSKLADLQIKYLKVVDIPSLRRILSEFDVVYSKNDILEAFILKFIAGQNINKLVYGFHTPIYYEKPAKVQDYLHNFLYNSWLYKNLINKADKFQVINQYDKLLLKKYFKEKTVQKIYNPFDFQGFEKVNQVNKDQNPRSNSKISILWVGRLTVEKGADDLIKLITELNKTEVGKGMTWNIAGAGDMANELKLLGERFNNINYLGYKNREELANLYNSNDIFLSTSKWETFPYTFVEAQCFGLPIISYDIHGCNEIVRNEITGYLVTTFDDLKNKLVDLIKNKGKLIKKNIIKKEIRKLIDNEWIYKKLYELLR